MSRRSVSALFTALSCVPMALYGQATSIVPLSGVDAKTAPIPAGSIATTLP